MDLSIPERIARALFVAAIPFALVLVKAALYRQLPLISLVEAGMHATYLGAFTLLFWPDSLWDRMPKAHRIVLGSMVVLLLWGQMNQKHSRRNFPFIAWNMYCAPAPSIEEGAEYTDVIGITKDGQQVDVQVVDLYPAIRNGFRARLGMTLRDNPPPETMERLLNALRDKYNALHPEQPIVEVQLKRMRLPVRWEGDEPAPVEVDHFP
jgi:hypothetical protein